MSNAAFSKLSDDELLNIFFKLEEDPRSWASVACVCTKFSTLIRNVCWKTKCLQTIPCVVDDLLSAAAAPSGGWAALHKLSVVCPGLLHTGVETEEHHPESDSLQIDEDLNLSIGKRRKVSRSMGSHPASGIWNLSREQGNKLLASRFRSDSLYICDWPGCVHTESKRNYMLFRGIFKDFKRSRVWNTISDGNRSRIDVDCAFCSCKETWDLHSAFCLRRAFGFHEDGEPAVRAYVCENGHVSGAWTELPLYT